MLVRSRILPSIVLLATLVLASSAAAQTVIDTLFIGTGPVAVAVNANINKIYVANEWDDTVGIINGVDDSVVTVSTGSRPVALAVDSITNETYVANEGDDDLTVIDALNNTATINVGSYPTALAFDATRNRIYVANTSDNSVSVIDGGSNTVIATIPVRNGPAALAVNPVTGKVYVANTDENTVSVIDGNNLNQNPVVVLVGQKPISVSVNTLTNKIYVVNELDDPGTMTVIDGATGSHTTVTVGDQPWWGDLDAVTNQIYVAVHYDTEVAVIDGATNNTSFVTLPDYPDTLAVEKSTNKIYVVIADSEVIVIDGLTRSTVPIIVGNQPDALAINESTNRIYVANYADNTVSVIAGASPNPAQFVPVTPCRLIDTRLTGGSIPGGTSRNFYVPQLGGCGIPITAVAYSLNVTAVPSGSLGYLSIWPTGQDRPVVSTLNSADGRVKADAAIVPAGYQGAVSTYVTDTANVILDINGYFAPVSGSTLEFFPLNPCRVADTRDNTKPPGLGLPYLVGLQQRDFPILNASTCNIPNSAAAYSLNVTVVPHGTLGYLSIWPTGGPRPTVSTLNDVGGKVIANAAIVPAGTDGKVTVYPTNDTDLVLDIDGYFAPPGAGGLSLYPATPCRVIDTRHVGNGQPFIGTLSPPVDVIHGPCGPPASAHAYVFNATVVPPGSLGYLTLWPDGGIRPTVSTLNAADGSITNNMAIVPTHSGKVNAYASGLTQLILDISSYFAP